eukprot:scaffold8619_cov52-Phaeocystis_antarctica.AAC.4
MLAWRSASLGQCAKLRAGGAHETGYNAGKHGALFDFPETFPPRLLLVCAGWPADLLGEELMAEVWRRPSYSTSTRPTTAGCSRTRT